jgi:GxxExxY protein
MTENEISSLVIGAALEVHKALGPGLLETVYQQALVREFELQAIPIEREMPIKASYKGVAFDAAYRLDLLVMDKVIVELKVVERLLPVHDAQLLSYLRLTNRRLGLLINFNSVRLRDGIRRIVNGL